MALHLITGYAGQEHVTSADQGAYNMGTYGEGEFVLDRGSKFAATVASNNSITIANGEAMMQGRFIKLPVGTTESVTIDNGTSGMKRKDLIVLRYSKNSSTGVETVAFAVKKGTPSSGTPSDPSVTTGNITDGNDLVNEMKLYRVNLDGINITSLDTIFLVKQTMVEYMDEYQLPVATASVLGGVKKGANINIGNDGTLSIPIASGTNLGVVRGSGDNVTVFDGYINVPTASQSGKGVVSVGYGLRESNGNLYTPRNFSRGSGSANVTESIAPKQLKQVTATITNSTVVEDFNNYRGHPYGVTVADQNAGAEYFMATLGYVRAYSDRVEVSLCIYNHRSDAFSNYKVTLSYTYTSL